MSFGLLDYSYNNNTAAPPAGGQLRLNNSNQTLATAAYFNDTDAPGTDMHHVLMLLGQGDLLVIQDKDDSTRFQRYVSGTPIDQAGYVELPITWTSGGTAFPSGQRVLIAMGSADTPGLPADGSAGQHLAKTTNVDYDVAWVTPDSATTPTPPPVATGYSGCEWPVDPACLGSAWEDMDPDTQERATALAGSTLRRLTGYRVGGCPVTVRPCRASCLDRMVTPGYWSMIGPFYPLNLGGVWVNSCGCRGDCSCDALCDVTLPGPVGAVYSVKVDGAEVTDYMISGNTIVWTGATDCPWPVCQDLTAADDQPNTFSVTYLNSYPVDGLGSYAAGVLAFEYAQACTGGKCRLPSNVTAVTRQGVSFEVASGSFPDGFTGIREVDAFIALWNPRAVRQVTSVWTPDLRPPRVIR